MRRKLALVTTLALLLALPAGAAKKKDAPKEAEKPKDVMSSSTFSGLAFRNLGPALKSGRICDFAVDPTDHATYYVAVCSGGVWKTVNAGTTWEPIFDGEKSYSIGDITLDPSNPHTVWVGTGENNSQRSVSWGSGVYRSDDDGASWKHMGLNKSEHIGTILVDPRDSDVVYVAAQGPLWGPGGDRGLYKSTDGGTTWTKVLDISENTGVNEVVMDPRDPDTLYAASYQRRRHVWTLINGGPESTVYKSTDAGATWKKIDKGLPGADKGKIGLAVSPADPDVVYAVVEAAEGKSGFFRSTNRGGSWEKRSDTSSDSAQYYNELFADPEDVDTVYLMDTFLQWTTDGGKTFSHLTRWDGSKHVDNHAMWIDPDDPDHLLVGCDGGVYETWDRARTYDFKANLPVTQFYRVEVDNSEPFYYVYGGTQDNQTQGGPSRTREINGIVNSDWFIVVGGDGYVPRIDPTDPNIVYGESQYGGLIRYDRRSGEEVDLQPQEKPGEAPNRWNWDSPLLLSKHLHTRLYFASQRVYRSDDRGDTWTAISGDLSRQVDRNALPVMDRVWPVDAVAKNASTSFYGNIVSLAESPLDEKLLYVGTDDGLIQVSEDGGASWRKVERVGGLPELIYVSGLTASRHDVDTVYACFDHHKSADFKPYVFKSRDRGRTWTSIAANLPADHVAYTLKEDAVDPKLLFLGTEYGVHFTSDGGGTWVQLKGGVPTIAVRDVAIQDREGDVVLGTFGRGFYVLDDYSPLRGLTRETLEKDAVLFPVKDALAYIEVSRLGGRDKADQGDSFFTAPNPPFGAVFTYYLKDEIQTRTEVRREREKEAIKQEQAPPYPSLDELRAEAREEKPAIVITVTDPEGNVVRQLEGPVGKGFHRVAWNLRYPATVPASARRADPMPWESEPKGPMAVPGTYKVSLARRVDGAVTPLAGPVEFNVVPLNLATLPAPDKAELETFQRRVAELQRAVLGARNLVRELDGRIDMVKQALLNTPAATAELRATARKLELRLADLKVELLGDQVVAEHNEPTSPSIVGRVQRIVSGLWGTTQAPTTTQREGYAIAGEAFTRVLADLKQVAGADLPAVEAAMEKLRSPHTPGRIPEWTMQ